MAPKIENALNKDELNKKRKRGGHLEWKRVKIGIIKFILLNDYPIYESKIREFVEKEYTIKDQKTVNKHLHDLQDLGCIKKISDKKGFPNRWDIKTIENIKNILFRFSELKLNEYSKPLFIILYHNNLAKIKEEGQLSMSLAGFLLYIQLLLSASFFRACIDTDVETLNKRALAIHMYKDTYETTRIEDSLNGSYNAYKKLYQNFELSFESFESMMRGMVHKKDEISSTEMFIEVWEKEFLGLSKEESNEIHQGSMEDYLKLFWEMRRTTIWISERSQMSEIMRLDLLFEAYFYQDVLNDDASEEETNFAIKTNASHEEFLNSRVGDGLEDFKERHEQHVLRNLEQISIVMANHKHPMIFEKEIYNDPKNILEKLKESFNLPSH